MARNFVYLEGKLTKFSLHKTKKGKRIAHLTIAAYNGNSGGPAYFNGDLWNPTKEMKTELKKIAGEGRIAVEGQLRQNKWEDEDGNKRYDIRILVESVSLAFDLPPRDDDDDDNRGKKGKKKKFTKKAKPKKKVEEDVDDDDDDDDDDSDDDDDDDENVPF
jgi:single-stranded DNA-binding protein